MNFAITYFSPIHPEMEICRRIEVAAKNLGYNCYFVGPDGVVLQNGKHISELHVDFVIVFDPAQITLFDCFVYHLMWFVPGLVSDQHAITYDVMSKNCDDHLCLPSTVALNYYKQVYSTVNDNYLYPSVPFNYMCQPRQFSGTDGDQFKAFYAGINVDSKTVRHEKIFRYLDQNNSVNLYGPKVINGKKNWVGFKSYRGEIPFDGHSMMEVANKSGVTLALHHKVHARFSMPTNRLFEGVAAGTLVITDRMQFIEDHFGDTVFMLDADADQYSKAIEIQKIIDWANSHPEEAREKILAAQKIFMDKFELTHVVKKLCESHTARAEELLSQSAKRASGAEVAVICDVYDELSFKEQYQNIVHQDYDNLSVIIVLHVDVNDGINEVIKLFRARYHIELIDLHGDHKYCDQRTIDILAKIRETMTAKYFIYSAPKQYWHHNHLRSLLESLIKTDSFVSYSGSYYLDESKKQIPILKNEILDFENKLFCTFCSERLHLCNLLQTELLKSSVMMRKEAIDLLQDNEIDFAYFYEHLVLILICYVNEKKITYSKKITTYLSDCPDFDKVEKDTQIYYRPLRNNWRMSYNSLQFVLNQVFAKNELVSSHLTKQRYSMGFDSHSFESKIGVGLLKFKRKIRKYHIIDSILAGFALLLSTISLIIFAI